MAQAELNVDQLDAVVLSYLHHHAQVRPALPLQPDQLRGTHSSWSPAWKSALAAIHNPQVVTSPEEELRALLLCGDFGGAAAALRRHCPQLADNQWLQAS